MAKRGPYLPNLKPVLAAGINPVTGLPFKMGGDPASLKEEMKRFLRLQDQQQAMGRFTWSNLPPEIDGNLLERMLYFKGQLAFFYMAETEQFYILPYALSGTIDVYGRYTGITPLPFGGGTTTAEGKDKPWITGLVRKPIYSVLLDEEVTLKDIKESAILLWDYSKGLSENLVPRCVMQDALLEVQSDLIPFMRTSLMNNTGVNAMKVADQSEQSNVKAASDSVYLASLTGQKYIPVVGGLEFQELCGNGSAQAQEYLMAYQSIDNIRASGMGLTNGGAYQKQGTILQSESDMNGGNTALILEDGLYQRQMFCTLVNSVFGTAIWCDISETLNMQPTMNENETDTLGQEQGQGQGQEQGGTTNNDEQ